MEEMKNRFGLIMADIRRSNMTKFAYALYLIFALIVFFAVNFSTGILNLALRSALSPLNQGPLFPLTFSLAISSFLLSLCWYRREGLFALPYAAGVPFLWVIFFEILWQNSFALVGTFSDNLTSEVILFSWLLIGTISFPTWTMDRLTLISFLLFSAGWMAWILIDYPQMPSLPGYFFNFLLKIGAFLVIIIMVMPRRSLLAPSLGSLSKY
ncbi:MAG: hypothetical protein ACYCT2_00220 [Thermoplasmataceae archaeon]